MDSKITVLVTAAAAVAAVGLLISYYKSIQHRKKKPPKDKYNATADKNEASSTGSSHCAEVRVTDNAQNVVESVPCAPPQTGFEEPILSSAAEISSNDKNNQLMPQTFDQSPIPSQSDDTAFVNPEVTEKSLISCSESSPPVASSSLTPSNEERSSLTAPRELSTKQCDVQPTEFSDKMIVEETITASASTSLSSSAPKGRYGDEEISTTSGIQVVEEVMKEVNVSYPHLSSRSDNNDITLSQDAEVSSSFPVPQMSSSAENQSSTSPYNHSAITLSSTSCAPASSSSDGYPDQTISSISLESNPVIETTCTPANKMSLSDVNDALGQLDLTAPVKSPESGDTEELEVTSTSIEECNKAIDEFTASIEQHVEEQDPVLNSAILAESLPESETATPSVTDSGISVSTTTSPSTTSNQLSTTSHNLSQGAKTHVTTKPVHNIHCNSTPQILEKSNDITPLNLERVSPTHTDNTDSTGSAPDLSTSDVLSNGSRGSMSNISPPGVHLNHSQPEIELAPGHIQHIFLMPTDVVGSFIGRFGKNILALKSQTHTDIRVKNEQVVQGYKVCVVQGKPEHVAKALRLIRRQYPKVNTTPMDHILRAAAHAKLQQHMSAVSPVIAPQSRLLSLPYNVAMEVYVCNIQTAGHIFVQMCSHPSYIPYTQLQKTFNSIYGDGTDVPAIPENCEPGVLCAAHLDDTWARAHVLQFDETRENCEVKLLDLGGYYNLPVSSLRQMRQDFISHPFQAIEIYIDEIIPLDESVFTEEAYQAVSDLTFNQALSCTATIPALNAPNVPYCKITVLHPKQPFSLAERLIELGVVSRYDTTIQPSAEQEFSEFQS